MKNAVALPNFDFEMTHFFCRQAERRVMGSCAVKSSQSIIDQSDNDMNQVVRILVNEEVKCPICCKAVGNDAEDPEMHLVMCLTRPKLHYNEDRAEKAKGTECVICLEELEEEDVIARLPCLCVYHKNCIDDWFKINRCCPQHPDS